MMRFPARGLAVFGLLVVSVFVLTGCWNPFAPDPGKTKPRPPADYHERLTPDDVIHNIETAYVWEDLDEYLDCLSEDFVFYPNEEDVQQNPEEIPPEWYKSDERRVHENMFSDNPPEGMPVVDEVKLTLTTSSIVHDEGPDPVDPLDDIYIYTVDVDLRVFIEGGTVYLATAPSEFHFRVDTDQQGDGGEPWWEIFQWFDLNPATPGPARGTAQDPLTERVSLGELLSLFSR